MNKNVETGGAKDVKRVTSIDFPITYEKTREVVNYLDSKPIISNPATMYKDLISQKQFKDIPYEVVRTIVAIYYEDKGKVVAKKLHSEIKQMFSAIPLNKYGANVKTNKMANKKLDGTEPEVTVKEFNSYFQKKYGYISHSLSDKQIEKYLNQPTIKRVSLSKKADYFQDYLLANGLTDDVQMMAGGNIKANIDDKNGLIYLNGAKHEFLIGNDGDVIYDWVNSKNKNEENGRMLVNELITIAGAREKTNQNERAKSIRKLAKFIKENLKPKMMAGGNTKKSNKYLKQDGKSFTTEYHYAGLFSSEKAKEIAKNKNLKIEKDPSGDFLLLSKSKMMAGGRTKSATAEFESYVEYLEGGEPTDAEISRFDNIMRSYLGQNFDFNKYISTGGGGSTAGNLITAIRNKKVSLPNIVGKLKSIGAKKMVAGGKTEYAKGGGVDTFVYTIGGL